MGDCGLHNIFLKSSILEKKKGEEKGGKTKSSMEMVASW